MMAIACVYKIGKDFKPAHVMRLREQVRRHVTAGYKFHCLTDCKQTQEILGDEAIALTDNLPGWWSKLELFKNFDNCFYMDLDVSIIGNIDEILQRPTCFKILHQPSGLNSTIMHWQGDYSCIYKHFKSDQARFMRECTTFKQNRWGDQGFLQHYISGVRFEKINNRPNEILSYKLGKIKTRGLPAECKILYFHGKPRPWEAGY